MDIGAAIAHYDALLAPDGALAGESAAMLLERQPAAHLLFGGRLMCHTLCPQLLDTARFAAIDRVLRGVGRGDQAPGAGPAGR